MCINIYIYIYYCIIYNIFTNLLPDRRSRCQVISGSSFLAERHQSLPFEAMSRRSDIIEHFLASAYSVSVCVCMCL